MSTIRDTFLGCVIPRSQEAFTTPVDAAPITRTPKGSKRIPKLKFGVPLSEAFKDDKLPEPLVAMLVHISHDGVTTTDVFRKGGNYAHIKDVMKCLIEGKPINFHQYSFHTLAAVVKRFLLKIPGGIFGSDTESKLLDVLNLENRMKQYDTIHSIIATLRPVTQQLVALLFGMWFRIVNHAESNHMSSEAVAKSIAPSLFHTCAQKKELIEKASQVLQILIDDFGVANMFGRKNIQYFADMTQSGINVLEKFRYEYKCPPEDSVPLDESLQLFVQYLQCQGALHGFDIEKHAISADDYYGHRKYSDDGGAEMGAGADSQASGGGGGLYNHLLSSSPPSPQSLQQHYPQHDADTGGYPNMHKKLTHVSSLSAPEVNQGCDSPAPELSSNKRMYLSISSLSRSDRVKHRQLMRMKKRSDWFLSPGSADSESMLAGSREPSVGTSSDALASDVTVSDTGMSDTGVSEGLRLSSDFDCTYDENCTSSEPLLKGAKQDLINANHGNLATTSTPLKSSLNPLTISMETNASSTSGSSPRRQISEKDVRYFMVENYYLNKKEKPS